MRLRISVQISVLLFAIANLNAQLQETGSLEGYRLSSAVKLNDAVLIATDAEYSSRENFFTKDFQNFVPAVAPNILRGSFNFKGS
ncbi:MAG: hypothetical protein U5L96_02200 [Owenweeksia sp.]|nr:hypothetical protein [Owenweeksia sp.]